MATEILQNIIDNFAIEKFNRFFREKSRRYVTHNESYVRFNDDNFKNGVKLGELNFESADNLLVCAFEVIKPLSERVGKKKQYNKAKSILKAYENNNFSAGIFIFYDTNDNFRFSLIYPEAIGTRRQWSNFRRFTYFVSRELTNKTFLQRIGSGDFSALAKIKDAFSVEKVTKDFYKDIANWYFWAVQHSQFPKDAETGENGRNIAIIRLITRLIFIWFMRERGLVPKALFQNKKVRKYLKDLSPTSSSYYKAILQNLFFATLSTRKEERKYASEKIFHKGWNQDYDNQYVFRYHELFKRPEGIKDYFGEIPFLNGGLFECLDDKKNGIIIDGFSRTKKNQPSVPNFLFFSEEKKADLNADYGTKNKTYKVHGLINILSAYNFTIDENDPDDAEIALDPELLGKVFENLLASFNPETASTARKATGSYYTPRVIVDYMVTESLKEYLKTYLNNIPDIEDKINKLFSKTQSGNPFSKADSRRIVTLIDNLRIVDPAVGSGAFPMGILNKLVFILGKVDPNNELWKEAQIEAVRKNVTDPALRRKLMAQINYQFENKNLNYGRKLYLIQKCIYGVDIQEIAVEIAKLRFFIALLVDEKIDKSQANWGIEPLPNLDFKIMQGNSLISAFMSIDFDNEEKEGQISLALECHELDDLINQFKERKNEFQNEYDKDKKHCLKAEIDDLIIKIFETKLKKQKADYFQKIKAIDDKYSNIPNKQQREAEIEREKQRLYEREGFNLDEFEVKLRQFTGKNKTKPFFAWKLYFAEVFTGDNPGFDIVIANPPYIKEYVSKSAFDGLRQSPYYQGKMDIWYMFTCKGLDILIKDHGILTFIAQNNWVTSYGASKMRNKVIKTAQILSLIDFANFKIFDAGIQTMVMLFRKNTVLDKYMFDYRRLLGKNLEINDVINLLDKKNSTKAEYLTSRLSRSKFENKTLTFNNPEVESILEKMLSKANFKLDRKKEVAQGIVCPQDYVNKSSQKILGGKYKIGDGIFTLSKKELIKLNIDKKESDIIKPFYTTNELHRWWATPQNRKLIIYTDSTFKNSKKIENYPNIKKHLDQFKKVITSDNKPYGLHRARDEYFFKGEKIITVRKCALPTFTYVDFDSYVSATFYVIKTKRVNQKYLTGVLNSKLVAFWLRHKGKMQGTNYQIDKEPLLALPLLNPDRAHQNEIVDLVDKILAITKADLPAPQTKAMRQAGDYLQNPAKQAKACLSEDACRQVHEYERQIDQLVYKLYGLTEEEIKVVRGKRFIKQNKV